MDDQVRCHATRAILAQYFGSDRDLHFLSFAAAAILVSIPHHTHVCHNPHRHKD